MDNGLDVLGDELAAVSLAFQVNFCFSSPGIDPGWMCFEKSGYEFVKISISVEKLWIEKTS